MMRAPGFWNAPPGLAARALAPLGAIYGALAAARMRRPGARVGKPVICVGNLTVGGAGKTPVVIALAKMFAAMGEKPFIVSRGYGGSEIGPLRVDPSAHDAARVGDEPLEIAAHAPAIVARDRAAGARAAIESGADVILLDDGLQNPSLEKTFSFAVIDAQAGFGDGLVLPAGPLRAPVAAQAPFIHAVILVGGRTLPASAAPLAGKPLFTARIEPDADMIAALRGRPALAFAGIGRPEKFFAALRAHGVAVAEARAFGDHRPYADSDLSALAARAAAQGWTPVTTMKDLARIGRARAERAFSGALRALPVALVFDDDATMRALLASALRA